MVHHEKVIPKSEGPSFQTKLPFQPNGVWTTAATTDMGYGVWLPPPPRRNYLAVATERGDIELLAWGEPAPADIFHPPESTRSFKNLTWQDNDTLICDDGAVLRHIPRIKRPPAPGGHYQTRKFSWIGPDGKPCLVQAPIKNESLGENGYNHIVTRTGRHRVAWLPSISSEKWCEVPGRNLAAYSTWLGSGSPMSPPGILSMDTMPREPKAWPRAGKKSSPVAIPGRFLSGHCLKAGSHLDS